MNERVGFQQALRAGVWMAASVLALGVTIVAAAVFVVDAVARCSLWPLAGLLVVMPLGLAASYWLVDRTFENT